MPSSTSKATVLLADADAQASTLDLHDAGDGKAGFPVIGLDRPTLDSQGAIYDRTIFAGSMADGSTAMNDEPAGSAAWEIHHLLKQIQEAFYV